MTSDNLVLMLTDWVAFSIVTTPILNATWCSFILGYTSHSTGLAICAIGRSSPGMCGNSGFMAKLMRGLCRQPGVVAGRSPKRNGAAPGLYSV
jgi:hypothetical protein